MTNTLFDILDDFLKMAEKTFTYQKIFDLTGVTDLLKEKYITIPNLKKKDIDFFYKAIEKFTEQPLFKDISLNDEGDLKFLRDNELFQDFLNKKVEEIQKNLEPYRKKILKYLKNYPPKEEISLAEIVKAVRLEMTALLFLLDKMKEDNDIYDYNGREVTLN